MGRNKNKTAPIWFACDYTAILRIGAALKWTSRVTIAPLTAIAPVMLPMTTRTAVESSLMSSCIACSSFVDDVVIGVSGFGSKSVGSVTGVIPTVVFGLTTLVWSFVDGVEVENSNDVVYLLSLTVVLGVVSKDVVDIEGNG